MKNNGIADIAHVQTLFERATRLFGQRLFLSYKDQKITYTELSYAVMHCATIMHRSGVKLNDRVVLVCDNSPLFYIGYFAAWHLGAVVVPLNSFLKMSELHSIIQDCMPTFLVTDQQRADSFSTELDYQFAGIFTEQQVDYRLVQSEVLPVDIQLLEPTKMAVLVYTSGTTGTPKGVMLSSLNILTNIRQCIAKLEIKSSEKILCILPMFHVFTQIICVWIAVAMGFSVIIVPKIERSHIIEGLTEEPTVVVGVPALFGLFCLFRTLDFASVRLFVAGGDAMPDKIRSLFALLYGRKIINGYGLSEASPVVAVQLEDTMEYTNTVGQFLDGIAYEIRNPEGTLCGQNQTGQLFVKGNNVMIGYYNDPVATNAVLQNGWLDTGDCAYIDECHNLVITGREKDLIISKGFNIYPQEVENIICLHPAVLRVAVVGKDDTMNGQIPVAFVQLRVESKHIQKELAKLCINHLAGYKIPRQFICSVNQLPMTATGKVDKKVLQFELNKSV